MKIDPRSLEVNIPENRKNSFKQFKIFILELETTYLTQQFRIFMITLMK